VLLPLRPPFDQFFAFAGCASYQKGTPVRSVPRSRRRDQISCANAERCQSGVARMSATASATLIWSVSPRIDSTAAIHAPRDCASRLGLYCATRLPKPARLNACAILPLQDRQDQARFAGSLSSAWPLMWTTPISRVLPQTHRFARPAAGSHWLHTDKRDRSPSWPMLVDAVQQQLRRGTPRPHSRRDKSLVRCLKCSFTHEQ